MKKNSFTVAATLALLAASFSASAVDLSCPKPHDPRPQECARVKSVVKKEKLGESTGTGTAVGAVGGVLGSMIFSDSLTAKVIGGVAGAAAGNYTQRKMNSKPVWVVDLIRFDGGQADSIELSADPHLVYWQPVRIQAGEIVWVGPKEPKPHSPLPPASSASANHKH